MHELLALLAGELRGAKCENARLDAELLMAHVLGVQRGWLYAHRDESLTKAQAALAQQLVARRANAEPLAQIIGRREFWSLSLNVNRHVLTPRPETECLVEAVLRLPLSECCEFVDAGTGSGAIALALLSERPAWQGTAIDADPDALAVCHENAQRLKLAKRLHIVRGDWLQSLSLHSIDLIVSNPPYIAASDPHLQTPELGFEPLHALASGSGGLDALREIIAAASTHLNKNGVLAVEHGYDQQQAVVALCRKNNLRVLECGRDLAGQARYVIATMSSSAS
ncbi:MAG: peptide chain release factor N(5)-glutamine methyltransferase [Gammaproteobacteria bacterium]|nr:peptide chain release factor N(5)-glutamine methyltransferase [Gammaproteobacteria bacterium]MBT8151120.1 peptide chain release factor N(5)-glutamine methyltransferase [Gammaproteobacteria bacterium]NND40263.1 peptide chain release factor N(5)-glutamine methyltransferase [Pseudomonadales bacterium]NNM11209.1 peptide chain release factor N(5)-glutamine methyltransferase [Pseudomonadales bacterium]